MGQARVVMLAIQGFGKSPKVVIFVLSGKNGEMEQKAVTRFIWLEMK